MTELFIELGKLGFSPLSCVLIVGIVAVWKWSEKKDRDQSTIREEQVEELRGHVKTCDDDRQALRKEQVVMQSEVEAAKKEAASAKLQAENAKLEAKKASIIAASPCQLKECPKRLGPPTSLNIDS